jgi:putative oxidoreductase
MKLGLTAFRAALGAVFIAHGTQKLFGWFGGPGLGGAAQGFESMGLKPGKRNAVLAGASETAGGAMLATGFLTPLGSAATIAVMGQAIRTVHWDKGFFNTQGGYEFNLMLAASSFALADTGPGPWSLDRALGLKLSGPGRRGLTREQPLQPEGQRLAGEVVGDVEREPRAEVVDDPGGFAQRGEGAARRVAGKLALPVAVMGQLGRAGRHAGQVAVPQPGELQAVVERGGLGAAFGAA